MADTLKFKKGVASALPAASNGQILFTTDTNELYIDDAGSHKQINANNAKSADKLNTNAGDSNTPVYFSNGKPVACTGLDLDTSGNAATATNVAWSGVTSKPSYYDEKAIKSITRSGTTFTYTCMDGTTGTFTQQDNNTTYSAGTGISLSGTTFSNSGVRSIATGSSNGTISVNTNGTAADVAVKGLGSNAYSSTAYLPLAGGTMTGALTFKNATATPAKGTILNCISGQYQNAAGNYYNIGLVDLVASAEADTTTSSGYARFGSHNGASFFTAGESGRTMPKALADAETLTAEAAYITADSSIIMYAGCANDAASYTKAMTVASAKVTSHVPLYGAVWNDYAEYRICTEEFEPGQVVYENGDDTMSISNNRLQRGCSIISDTFGFAIGETDEATCPIAVSGRVLAYGYESREEFKKHIGWPVCSGPNGTVSIMTEEEEEKYPSRIIGTVSAVPDYETWGSGNIEVNNRIWIKIK